MVALHDPVEMRPRWLLVNQLSAVTWHIGTVSPQKLANVILDSFMRASQVLPIATWA